MTERIHQGEIDEAAILAWGYDEDMLFDSQDEDLVVGACREHYPLLAKFAQDPSCPKANYCLSIMDFSLMFDVLLKRQDAADRIRQTLDLVRASARPEVAEFVRVNELRLALMRFEPKPTKERALELGRAALIGVSRVAEISIMEGGKNWIVELTGPHGWHKELLWISRETGEYWFQR
jgi:hypothetical protein